MSTADFEDLLNDPRTLVGARQILDDMLRRVPEHLTQLCSDRLEALRRRAAAEQRHPSPDDDNLP